MFLVFHLIFTQVASEILTVFKTEDGLLNISADHGAKLAKVYKEDLTEITICFRFYNHQIENHYLMSFTGTFKTYLEWTQDGSKVLLFQKFNNQFVQPTRQVLMDRISPRLWHGYCFSYNKGRRERKVYVDAEEVLADVVDDEAEIPDGFVNNITFMSSNGYPSWSALDMITDINIWNVTLAPDDVKMWNSCRIENLEKYRIVDWRTAMWTTRGIETDVVDRSTVCYKKEEETKIYFFLFQKTYLDSVDFCHLLGGEIALANDNTTALEMNGKCKSFAGYNDIETEGTFINPYTGEEVDDSAWASHEPNNFGVGEDCTNIELNGLFNDISCSSQFCTICNLKKRPQFELRGFCPSEPLDIKYYMDVDDRIQGVYDILGWRGTSLTWNEERKRWEFVELNENSSVAFCNDTMEYPFGVQR